MGTLYVRTAKTMTAAALGPRKHSKRASSSARSSFGKKNGLFPLKSDSEIDLQRQDVLSGGRVLLLPGPAHGLHGHRHHRDRLELLRLRRQHRRGEHPRVHPPAHIHGFLVRVPRPFSQPNSKGIGTQVDFFFQHPPLLRCQEPQAEPGPFLRDRPGRLHRVHGRLHHTRHRGARHIPGGGGLGRGGGKLETKKKETRFCNTFFLSS